MTELRVYLSIEDLQPQFAAYMSTPVRARGYPPMQGDNSLIVEVTPALSIHRLVDLALKAEPDMEPGILFTERRFGLLELHSRDPGELREAGEAILRGIGAKASDQLAPSTLYTDVIEHVGDQHAIILNRMRNASMILPGQSLLLYEMAPALFAAVAANEAERAAPEATIVDIQMMGATGRDLHGGTRRRLWRTPGTPSRRLSEGSTAGRLSRSPACRRDCRSRSGSKSSKRTGHETVGMISSCGSGTRCRCEPMRPHLPVEGQVMLVVIAEVGRGIQSGAARGPGLVDARGARELGVPAAHVSPRAR